MSFLKCGSPSYHNVAMIVAIIDVISTSVLLILFVLGSSLMIAFAIIGKPHNATRVLDIVTDEVLGQVQTSYNSVRERKDVAEDMGVWLIVMFLTVVDFIISCVFLDGVKTRNSNKCQVYLSIRLVIIAVFKIVVLINLIYGTSFLSAIPDMLMTVYRIFAWFVAYKYYMELTTVSSSSMSTKSAVIGQGNCSSVPTISVSPPPSSVCDDNDDPYQVWDKSSLASDDGHSHETTDQSSQSQQVPDHSQNVKGEVIKAAPDQHQLEKNNGQVATSRFVVEKVKQV